MASGRKKLVFSSEMNELIARLFKNPNEYSRNEITEAFKKEFNNYVSYDTLRRQYIFGINNVFNNMIQIL